MLIPTSIQWQPHTKPTQKGATSLSLYPMALGSKSAKGLISTQQPKSHETKSTTGVYLAHSSYSNFKLFRSLSMISQNPHNPIRTFGRLGTLPKLVVESS